MNVYSFLLELLFCLSIATVIAYAFERLKLPPLLAYLLSGALIGPFGFSLIANTSHIDALADLGIFFLMLTIGLEFSLDRIKGIEKVTLIGGLIQITFSIFLSVIFASLMGWSLYRGLFLGSVIALSSTAIVLKFLSDLDQIDTQYARVAVGILIFQDFAVVPLILLLSGVSVGSETLVKDVLFVILKSFSFIGGVTLFSKYFLRGLVGRIVATQNRELFFLSAMLLCLGTACLSHYLGLSFAMGAFVAGLMLANTNISYQVIGEMNPFRHIFVSIFFISIGLLFDVRFLFDHLLVIFSVVCLVIVINFILMTAIVMIFGFAPRVALAVGLILSQVGEFSFLLIDMAKSSNQIDDFFYRMLLTVVFVTMFLTPFLFRLLPFILKTASRAPIPGMPPSRDKDRIAGLAPLRDHIILCGFGPTGKDLAASFKQFVHLQG